MIGRQLGQYKILEELGRGGMGIVYKAYQISLNREVALKILPPQFSADENLIKRFHREAESAARLSHPNIVQIFDIDEIDGIHFFAMEYVKGETLTKKIEREGALSIEETVNIGLAVADALSYSHTEGLIHRDIKPGNIMIDSHSHVKVTDFGLARAVESARLTMTGTIIGTPEYMSPEQARGDTIDGRSDIYSLGIVLYEALTGKLPFEASTPFAVAQKQIYDPLPLPSSIRPEIPDALENIILNATKKEPELRYQRGEDFKRDLENFKLEMKGISPTIPLPPEAPPKKGYVRRKVFRRLCWVGGAVVVAGTVMSLLPKKGKHIEEFKPEEETVEVSVPKTDEAREIIEKVNSLIAHGDYDEAISILEKFAADFPDHPQAAIIPKWIEEIQDKQAKEKFDEAQHLAENGEIVQAILGFNQVMEDYPGTRWAASSSKKVEELEKALKEGEAEKEFLKAQELKKNSKFIEATQVYQDIVNRFPETSWADRARAEIDRLKELQAHFGKRGAYDKRFGVRREHRPEFEALLEEVDGIIEDMRRDEPRIEYLIRDGDEKKLAGYLWLRHREELNDIADILGVPEGRMGRRFPHAVARYIMGDTMALEMILRMLRRDFRFSERQMEDRRPEEDIMPKERLFKEFKAKTYSDKTLQGYIDRGDSEGMRFYLMTKYYDEIKEMSEELGRPFRDMAWELSESLVHHPER